MDTPVVANRRKNLKLWIDLHYSGSQAKFISATEINQGELSALLKNKSFGEKKARSIERVAQMPTMWLDTSNQSSIHYTNSGSGTQNNLVGSTQINHLSGSLLESLHNYTQTDQSMSPVIPEGSPLWTDTADTVLQNGKTYLVEYGGLQTVRRLFAEADGQIRLKPYHADYSETTLPAEQIRIIGRVVRWCVED